MKWKLSIPNTIIKKENQLLPIWIVLSNNRIYSPQVKQSQPSKVNTTMSTRVHSVVCTHIRQVEKEGRNWENLGSLKRTSCEIAWNDDTRPLLYHHYRKVKVYWQWKERCCLHLSIQMASFLAMSIGNFDLGHARRSLCLTFDLRFIQSLDHSFIYWIWRKVQHIIVFIVICIGNL